MIGSYGLEIAAGGIDPALLLEVMQKQDRLGAGRECARSGAVDRRNGQRRADRGAPAGRALRAPGKGREWHYHADRRSAREAAPDIAGEPKPAAPKALGYGDDEG